MTRRQQVRDAVIAALNAELPTGVPEAGKRRYVPGTMVAEPRIAVFFGEENIEQRPAGWPSGIEQRDHTMIVQAIVAVESPDQADDAMEPLLAHIADTLGGNLLDGLLTDTAELGVLWQQGSDNASAFYLSAWTRWRLQFQTKVGDVSEPS